MQNGDIQHNAGYIINNCSQAQFFAAMNSHDTIELKAHSVSYLSEYDEAAFFEWLDKLDCVSKYEGQGEILYIEILPAAVDEYALRELLALFYRYGVDMKQLAIFDREEFVEWFRGKEAYWSKAVFS